MKLNNIDDGGNALPMTFKLNNERSTIKGEDWPVWALFHVNDKDGSGWFYARRPQIEVFENVWNSKTLGYAARSNIDTNGDNWESSLISRTESKATEKMGNETPFTAVQIKQLASGERKATFMGSPVDQIHVFKAGTEVIYGVCRGFVHSWKMDGSSPCGGHLIIEPITHERFINLYPSGRCPTFTSKSEADRADLGFRIHIEWSEK